jgi:four helix bundle protein
MAQGYKDLIVWQKSIKLVMSVYQLTQDFPSNEVYGLTSQMRRCSVSIPSNIAEGSKRRTQKDFKQFLAIAFGSAAELETQLEISKQLKFGDIKKYTVIENFLSEVMRMLTRMIS